MENVVVPAKADEISNSLKEIASVNTNIDNKQVPMDRVFKLVRKYSLRRKRCLVLILISCTKLFMQTRELWRHDEANCLSQHGEPQQTSNSKSNLYLSSSIWFSNAIPGPLQIAAPTLLQPFASPLLENFFRAFQKRSTFCAPNMLLERTHQASD